VEDQVEFLPKQETLVAITQLLCKPSCARLALSLQLLHSDFPKSDVCLGEEEKSISAPL